MMISNRFPQVLGTQPRFGTQFYLLGALKRAAEKGHEVIIDITESGQADATDLHRRVSHNLKTASQDPNVTQVETVLKNRYHALRNLGEAVQTNGETILRKLELYGPKKYNSVDKALKNARKEVAQQLTAERQSLEQDAEILKVSIPKLFTLLLKPVQNAPSQSAEAPKEESTPESL